MPYQEEALFSHHLFAAWEAKDKLPSANIAVKIDIPDACFLEQLADGGFFKCLVIFEATARCGPVAQPSKSISLVNEAEQENCTIRVQDE
ncbi:hypothetical protein ROTAS13_02318 [Roseomonas sp. TAS13]|nr:hypothetical protein ROTAS13_02318 [Roseomonas sp. TAS13]